MQTNKKTLADEMFDSANMMRKADMAHLKKVYLIMFIMI